jgi:mycoredoxin
MEEINIWEDPDGAAFVRSVTGGDETVPTVRIGTQSLVNPSPRELLELVRTSSG